MDWCVFLLLPSISDTCFCKLCMKISWALADLTRSYAIMWQENFVQLGVAPWLDSFSLSLCSQRTLLRPNLSSPPTTQFVSAAEAVTGLFQVSHGALTSTVLCLLSRKWHTRLTKPAWFHLSLSSRSDKWLTKMAGCHNKTGHWTHWLQISWVTCWCLVGEINSAVNLGLWESECVFYGEKKKDLGIVLLVSSE